MSTVAYSAPVAYTFDFTTDDALNPAPGTYLDNDWTAANVADGIGLQAKVSYWSDTGSGGSLESASGNLMTNGLGACNENETSCSTDVKDAGLDNHLGNDWVLVLFYDTEGNSATVDLSTLTVFPETETTGKKVFKE